MRADQQSPAALALASETEIKMVIFGLISSSLTKILFGIGSLLRMMDFFLV